MSIPEPSDREAHEQECLEHANTTIAFVIKHVRSYITTRPRLLGEAHLHGSYPDTRLVVQLTCRDDHAELDWQLWGGDDFGELPVGNVPSPIDVAQDVQIQVGEWFA